MAKNYIGTTLTITLECNNLNTILQIMTYADVL